MTLSQERKVNQKNDKIQKNIEHFNCSVLYDRAVSDTRQRPLRRTAHTPQTGISENKRRKDDLQMQDLYILRPIRRNQDAKYSRVFKGG